MTDKSKITRDIGIMGVTDHACHEPRKDGQGLHSFIFCFDFRGYTVGDIWFDNEWIKIMVK